MLKSMRIARKFLLLMALLAVSIISVAQEKDDLQEFINSANSGALTRADNVTLVDLSLFSSTTRKTTLTISTGGNYLFVNGTLDRDTSLNAPVMLISGGSSVDIGQNTLVTGMGHMNDDISCEIIRLEGGTLNITEGIVEGSVGYRHYNDGNIIYLGNPLQDPAVRLTSNDDRFYLGNGIMYGLFICESKGAEVRFDNGKIRGMGLREDDETSMASANTTRAAPQGSRSPIINTFSDVYINQTTSKDYTWGDLSIVLPGGTETQPTEDFDPFPVVLHYSSVLHLQNGYKYGFSFNLYDKKEGDIVAVGEGYTITQEDVKNMNSTVWYTSEDGYKQEERKSYLKLKDNKVYLTYKYTIDNEDDLQAKLDEIAENGTFTYNNRDTIVIADGGIDINKGLHLRNKCHAVLTGGPLRISPKSGGHYCININSGASLTLNDITVDLMDNDFSLNSGIFYIYGILDIGSRFGGNVNFINVPITKGEYGESIFYVGKGAHLYLYSGRIETHNLSVVKAISTSIVYFNGSEIESSGVPTIDGDARIYLMSGKVAGYSKDKGIIVADSIHVTTDNFTIQDMGGGSVFFRAYTAMLEGKCKFVGKYNKIIIYRQALIRGDLDVPTIFIDVPEKFGSLVLPNKLSSTNGWEIETSDWSKMPMDKSIVKGEGYVLTQQDFEKIKFLNLPESIEAYLDETDNSVKLRQKASADDLQDFINEQSGNVITVDLSKFSATTRNKTLEIRTGKYYKFVNGTLEKAADCTEPLITISNGSSVEIGSIDNSNDTRAWVTANGVINGVETIRMEGGSLTVLGGVLDGGYTWNSEDYDNAVLMTSNADKLILAKKEGAFGWVSGPIVCNASKAYISIDCNMMHTNTADFGTVKSFSDVIVSGDMWMHIELLGKANVVKLTSALKRSMEIKAMERTYDDTIMEGYDFQLSSDPNIKNFKYIDFKGNKEYQLRLENNKVVLGIDDLQDFIDNPGEGNGTGTEDDPIKGNIGCDGVDVNDDLKFKDDLQYFITGQQAEDADCQGTIRQNEGDVTIPTGSTVTYTYLYLHGCGCQKYIYVYGTLIIDYNIYIYNYLRFIYLRPGGRIIIRGLNGEVADEIFYVEGGTVEYRGGNSAGGKYGWWNNGGTVYIYDGTIKGGTCGGYTGANGVSYIYGGTVVGGIHNYGTTYIYGGVITGGSGHTIYNYQGGIVYVYGGTCDGPGTIWNQGTIYIDGCNTININEIHVILGCRIYIINKLTYLLRLNITVENIVLDTPIILGGNGYILTAEDCRNLQITLPEGYGWRYDEASCGIVIYSTSGIADVNTEHSTVNSSYDVSGRKIRSGSKGLNIQRMKDGSVRKVMNQ